jgi:hypothetical protein
MRALKPEEMELVAGGDGTTITVTGTRTERPPSYYEWWKLSGSEGGGGSGTTGGGFGGGGAGSTGVVAGSPHTTDEGHVYVIDINLTAAQTAVVDDIVDYGKDHGYSEAEIDIAVTDAYYESSFSQSETNGTHIGLYQYSQQTWSDLGESGSIYNTPDQIAAIYHDISRYGPRYETAISNN